MGHFFSKLFRRGGCNSSGDSDDTQKITSSGSSTKKQQPQHSIKSPSISNSQNNQKTNDQYTVRTANENANQPTLSRQNESLQQPQQRYPLKESNETSPTSRPHIVYRSAPSVQPTQQTESSSPVPGNQEVEDAVIKIQALVRGHLTRKALKDGSTMSPPLGERQFDERCLYHPPSAVFLPSSPFNITSIQSQNRNHHKTQQLSTTNSASSQQLQDNNRSSDSNTIDTSPATGGNVDDINGPIVNNNDVSYDVNNNNHTAGNNNNDANNITDINHDTLNNNSEQQPEASRTISLASNNATKETNGPEVIAALDKEDSLPEAVTTELNISTARLFLDKKQLSADIDQQQQSTLGTPATASASLIINDYLSTNNNDDGRPTSVPFATVLHPAQSVAPKESSNEATTTTPTIVETKQQDEDSKETNNDAAQTNGSNVNNRLNVHANTDQYISESEDGEDDTLETRVGLNQRRSRQSTQARSNQRIVANNNSANQTDDIDSPTTPAEAEDAAIKIQSAFRGYRTRKNSPYRSSSARRSPATPSELDTEHQQQQQQIIPNGYHQTVGDIPSSPAEINSNDQQQGCTSPMAIINSDDIVKDDGVVIDMSISQSSVSNLANRRLARQRPTENHSSGSVEDQNLASLTSSTIQSVSLEDENTCTVIEGRSQITNDKEQSVDDECKIEDEIASKDKLNDGQQTKQNIEDSIKSYSIDVIQQHNREFDSEKFRAKSLEQYHQQWPSQEQDTDSSALGAASSYNEDTEEEGGHIMTTTTNLTNDEQQLYSALEVAQDNNCSEAGVNLNCCTDDDRVLPCKRVQDDTMFDHGNILPRESINSTTADLSFANEDEDSMMRQVQQMVDEMETTNTITNQDEDDNNYITDTKLQEDESTEPNEDKINLNDDNNSCGIVCESETRDSSDPEEEIGIDDSSEDSRKITKKNSTETSDQVRLEVITEEDLDLEQQQQALIEGQHTLEMESDDIEKRDPTGDMSNERKISSPKILMASSSSFEKRILDGAVNVELNEAIDVPKLNVELVNLQKADSELQRARKNSIEDELNKDKLIPEDKDDDDKMSFANSGCSSTCGNSGTDDEDDENGDAVNNDQETSGQLSVTKKDINNGTANNQEKKGGSSKQNPHQTSSNKNRNKKNKRKGKK